MSDFNSEQWSDKIHESFCNKVCIENSDYYLDRYFDVNAVDQLVINQIFSEAISEKFTNYNRLKKITESPIEQVMLAGLILQYNVDFPGEKLELRDSLKIITFDNDFPLTFFDYHIPQIGYSGVVIIPQVNIGDFRVDFLVAGWQEHQIKGGLVWQKVLVECDGHDYHERTKEQASRDKKKDRFLQKEGYTVFRFSGSDIWKDVSSCCGEIYEFINERLYESSGMREREEKIEEMVKQSESRIGPPCPPPNMRPV